MPYWPSVRSASNLSLQYNYKSKRQVLRIKKWAPVNFFFHFFSVVEEMCRDQRDLCLLVWSNCTRCQSSIFGATINSPKAWTTSIFFYTLKGPQACYLTFQLPTKGFFTVPFCVRLLSLVPAGFSSRRILAALSLGTWMWWFNLT